MSQQTSFNFRTYDQAVASLGGGATWSSSFGYPSDEGYSVWWRVGASRYEIRRRSWFESNGYQVSFID